MEAGTGKGLLFVFAPQHLFLSKFVAGLCFTYSCSYVSVKKKEKKAHLPNTLQECGISTPVLGVCTSSVFAPKHKATGASLVAQMAKNLSAVLETWV